MPLRGSKVKPEGDLQDKIHDLNEAKKELKQSKAEIADVQHTIHKIEDMETSMEIREIVRRLEERVRALEEEKKVLEEKQSKMTKALIYTVKQLACGGLAGAVARSAVAPIDRAKILMQTQHVLYKEVKYKTLFQTWGLILKEEGALALWKGNLPNVARVIPYSALQFTSYDFFKHRLIPKDQKPTTFQRLSAGACAAITATTFTHPLDVLRLRLAVTPSLKGVGDTFRSIIAENGVRSLFKGYTPTVLSLSPFIAINFATFDALKTFVYPDPKTPPQTIVILGLGACAGLWAQTCCYPLDTVRRRMQLPGKNYKNTYDAFLTILKKEGLFGFYRGMIPNIVKIIPNNAIRFATFELLKDKFGVQRSSEGGGGGGG